MDEFLESANKGASFLEEALEHIDLAISSLEEAMVLNENEELIGTITDTLSGIYEDIDTEKTTIIDSADAIKEIVLDVEE